MKKRIGLIGYGNYGKFVRGRLSEWFDVSVYDPAAGKPGLPAVLSSDYLLLAVPVSSLPSLIRKIRNRLSPGTVVADLSSVKVKPLAMLGRGLKNPVIGIHTLFGPESAKNGVKGLTVILCRDGSRPSALSSVKFRHVRRFLEKKAGLKVVELTAEEHDRQMAWVQGLSHFVSKALERMETPALPFRTGSFDRLMEMRHILRKTTWPLFETIEKENPYAAGVRKNFISRLKKLDDRLAARRKGKRR